MATNYAQALGIQNKWAPIVFAVVYFFIFVYYVSQAIRRHATIYGGLAFFSALRVVSFSLRAAMANKTNDATNKAIGITYEVLYSVGFFSLLLSAYNLLHNREKLARLQRLGGRFTNALHRSGIVHLLIFIAVVLGTVGIVYALGTWGHQSLGDGLNSASTYIFAVVAVIIAIVTLLLIHLEQSLRRQGNAASPIGTTHHHLILILIALLLLLRSLFYAVTIHDRLSGTTFFQSAQSNERLWYPLAALAEILAALLFLVPGLVPLRSLLARHRANGAGEKDGYNNGAAAGNGAGYNGPGVGYNGTGAGYNGTGAGYNGSSEV